MRQRMPAQTAVPSALNTARLTANSGSLKQREALARGCGAAPVDQPALAFKAALPQDHRLLVGRVFFWLLQQEVLVEELGLLGDVDGERPRAVLRPFHAACAFYVP